MNVTSIFKTPNEKSLAQEARSEIKGKSDHIRIVVFGANGRTGRQLLDQALAAEYQVVAVTRQPQHIRPCNGLTVIGANVNDLDAVAVAISGSDAVLSVLGVSFSRKPIRVYSHGAANIIAAMEQQAAKRLLIVSSNALDPAYRPSDSVFFNSVLEPLFMRIPGSTAYEDMHRMESLVRASDLKWTIIRSSWLFDNPTVTDYQIAESRANGMFTARADLAASMLAQVTDDQFIRKTIGVITTAVKPGIIRQIWREITKEKGNA